MKLSQAATRAALILALSTCISTSAASRTPINDFLDPEPLVQAANEFCDEHGGCFDVGSKYATEWLVSKVEIVIEDRDGTYLLHTTTTSGSIVPNRFDTFRATEAPVTRTTDLQYVVLQRSFSIGTVISLETECAVTEICEGQTLYLSLQPQHVEQLRHRVQVLVAIAKDLSHGETFRHFCPPMHPGAQPGDVVFDWCDEATRFMQSLHNTPLAIAQDIIESYCDAPILYRNDSTFSRREAGSISDEIGSDPDDLFLMFDIDCDSWNSSWHSSPWRSPQCLNSSACIPGSVGVVFGRESVDGRWQVIAYAARSRFFPHTMMLVAR